MPGTEQIDGQTQHNALKGDRTITYRIYTVFQNKEATFIF